MYINILSIYVHYKYIYIYMYIYIYYVSVCVCVYIYIYIYIYIYKSKVKLATVVEGYPKAPFPIATTPRYREGTTPLLRLLHFTLETNLIMLSVKQRGIKDHFLSLWYDTTRD